MRTVSVLAVLVALILTPPPQASAVTTSVATEAEFRAAIDALESAGPGPHTIEITQSFTIESDGDPSYIGTAFVTIVGVGEGIVVDSTAPDTRFLWSGSTATIVIDNLTLEGFNRPTSAGGAVSAYNVQVNDSHFTDNSATNGGALYGANSVTLNESEFSYNTATTSGGAVYSLGTSAIVDTSFQHNEASDEFGGALFATDGAFIHGSRFAHNSSAQDGGAIHAGSSLNISETTVEDNVIQTLGNGGGAYAEGDVEITTSTFTENSASTGGAVYADGEIVTSNSTFAHNSAIWTGALRANDPHDIWLIYTTVYDNPSYNHVQIHTFEDFHTFASVVAEPGFSNDNCSVDGDGYSYGFNYVDDTSCLIHNGDDLDYEDVGSDPGLGALADNGGPTATMRPQADSPLSHAIAPQYCEPPFDQRGVARPQGSGCTVGAVEVFDQFSDVSDEQPAHPFMVEIAWMASTGMTTGYADGTFKPSNTVTRQALAAFLFRLEDEAFVPPTTPTFTDVPTSHPFFEEIEWMAANDITTGFDDGTFRPALAVSRQATAAFLFRLTDPSAWTAPAAATFNDVPTDHPFYNEIVWLADTGISTGYSDGTFRGGNSVTRQAAAAFLYRLAYLP